MRKVFGYARISRDDNGRNYSSIENQIQIIECCAREHGDVPEKVFTDDGVSGYTFDRPAFEEMLKAAEEGGEKRRGNTEKAVIYIKDFSRLGRHNAKVLLMLEEFAEKGIRVISADDNYDSFSGEYDDFIGIKTWFNERYLKDISRKIKSSLSVKQRDGSLIISPKFGYESEDGRLKICTEYAPVIHEIDVMFLNGFGYEQIAEKLNNGKVPTPSESRYLRTGKCRGTVKTSWSPGMVREILKDDYYIGTFRTHKRERKRMHGGCQRIARDEQCVFRNHHEAIRSEKTYNEILKEMDRRKSANRVVCRK